MVQRLYGLKDDGVVGPKTLAKLNGLDQKALFSALWNQRKNFLQGIATGKNSVFLRGWMRRLNAVTYGKLTCNGGQVLE